MELSVFALQRLGDRWLVRSPVDDPHLPAVVMVETIDTGSCPRPQRPARSAGFVLHIIEIVRRWRDPV